MSSIEVAPGSFTKVIFSWHIEKYARFILDDQTVGPSSLFPVTGEESGKASNTGSWQTYSFKAGQTSLCLLQGNHLLLKSGSNVLESFSLVNARQWLRGVTRGESMLFVCKSKEKSRRFRVKFAPAPDSQTTSTQACKSCCEVLEAFFSIRDASSAAGTSELQGGTQSLSQNFLSQFDKPAHQQLFAGSLMPAEVQQVSIGPQQASIGPQQASIGPQQASTGFQLVSAGSQQVSTGPQQASTGFQLVSAGSQQVSTGPVLSQNTTHIQLPAQNVVPMETSMMESQSIIVPAIPPTGVYLTDTMTTDVQGSSQSSTVLPEDASQTEEFQNGSLDGKLKSTADILKEVMTQEVPLLQGYAECSMFEQDLSSFIRLCLTDQLFPDYVDRVDKELCKILP